jgi:phospholipase/carboxylesterase
MTPIDGPRLPASGDRTSALVVFLHGYGADGNDLIDIGRAWQPHLPGVAFVSPHAPAPCGMSPSGREWFPLTFRDPHETWRGVVQARPVLDRFIDAECERLKLTAKRVVLVGFSQGTMMALHTGLRRGPRIGAVVGYSGMLAGPEHLAEVNDPPPVTLIHGDRDDVLPIAMLHGAVNALAQAGIPVTFHISPGVAHGIDQRGLALGLNAVAAALGIRLRA